MPGGTYSGVSFTGGGATDIRIGGPDWAIEPTKGKGGEANREQWRGGDGEGLMVKMKSEARGDAMEEVHRHGSSEVKLRVELRKQVEWAPIVDEICSTII